MRTCVTAVHPVQRRCSHRCSVEPYLLRVRALRTLENASARCERHGPRHTNYACAQDTATLPRATLLTLRSTSDNNHFYPNTTTNKPNPFTHLPLPLASFLLATVGFACAGHSRSGCTRQGHHGRPRSRARQGTTSPSQLAAQRGTPASGLVAWEVRRGCAIVGATV